MAKLERAAFASRGPTPIFPCYVPSLNVLADRIRLFQMKVS